MELALLKYSNSTNLGDNIQTLAVAQHVTQTEYKFVDRDFLDRYEGDEVAIVMNGWFTHNPQNWPPSPKITPIFFGFHLTPSAVSIFERHKGYFAKFAPIGCRDQATANIVRTWGVEAYMSGCATMTFPSRRIQPAHPITLFVDQKTRYIAPSSKKGAMRFSHFLPIPMDNEVKLAVAGQFLDFYHKKAGLVVTSRIHCAMPCAAIGIPVIYTGVRDGRTAVIDMIGIPSARTTVFTPLRLNKSRFPTPSFEDTKKRITADLHGRLRQKGIDVRMPN